MFGVNMNSCNVRSIDSYAEAVSFYDRCKARRGSAHGDERPIKGKEGSKQIMGVRIEADRVMFRYHYTDVVQWRPDNSIRIEIFNSPSTCRFAYRFLPMNVELLRDAHVLRVGDTFYPTASTVVVKPDRSVDYEGHAPYFYRYVINRTRAKAALAKTRYAEYRAWFNLMFPIIKEAKGRSWEVEWLDGTTILELLRDEEQWYRLMMSYQGNPDEVRSVIYRDNDVKDIVRTQTLPTTANLGKWAVHHDR